MPGPGTAGSSRTPSRAREPCSDDALAWTYLSGGRARLGVDGVRPHRDVVVDVVSRAAAPEDLVARRCSGARHDLRDVGRSRRHPRDGRPRVFAVSKTYASRARGLVRAAAIRVFLVRVRTRLVQQHVGLGLVRSPRAIREAVSAVSAGTGSTTRSPCPGVRSRHPCTPCSPCTSCRSTADGPMAVARSEAVPFRSGDPCQHERAQCAARSPVSSATTRSIERQNPCRGPRANGGSRSPGWQRRHRRAPRTARQCSRRSSSARLPRARATRETSATGPARAGRPSRSRERTRACGREGAARSWPAPARRSPPARRRPRSPRARARTSGSA